MFLFENIARHSGRKHPLPTNKGLVVYEVDENKKKLVEAISFFWENAKGRPNYYNFRFSKLIKGIKGEYFLEHKSYCIPWDQFFDYWNTIKIRLKRRIDVDCIASDALEAKWLLWKSFIVTQDYTLSKYIHNFPLSFYNSLNDKLSVVERTRNIQTFLFYLRDAMPYIYNGWNTYFESNLDYHFCYWFKEYFMQNDE